MNTAPDDVIMMIRPASVVALDYIWDFSFTFSKPVQLTMFCWTPTVIRKNVTSFQFCVTFLKYQ